MSDDRGVLQGARILLVDDTPANLDVLCELLEMEGCDLSLATDGAMALTIAARMQPDLILLDVMMPEMDGFEVCRRLQQDPELMAVPIIFVTAKGGADDVVAGLRLGGVDYVTKPFRDEEVLARVRTQLSLGRLRREMHEQNQLLEARNDELAATNKELAEQIAARKRLKGQLSMLSEREAERWGVEGFVGRSQTLGRILDDIRLMQENARTSVVISGESGTGKELVARAIHFGSGRGKEPFVPVNCASMPGELAESLLFGHVRGAFTGAQSDRTGFFELAHGGTLFLDEIGEMPLELQAKLLRVLEDDQVWRVGAQQGRTVDVRVLAATNVDLERGVEAKTFRQDLYFRLARFTVQVPALRDHADDIPLLVQHFLQFFAAEMGRDAPAVEPGVLDLLQQHTYPGNVRELKNIIERGLIQSRGGDLRTEHLHFVSIAAPNDSAAPAAGESLEENERRYIQSVLERTNWVIRGAYGAAAVLEMPESTLRGRMKQLGIQRPR